MGEGLRLPRDIGSKTRECERTGKIVVVRVVVQPTHELSTGLEALSGARIHPQIAKLECPIVVHVLVLSAARVKRSENVNLITIDGRIGTSVVPAVREPKLVYQLLTQNRGFAYLVLRILSVPCKCAFRQNKTANALVLVLNALMSRLKVTE